MSNVDAVIKLAGYLPERWVRPAIAATVFIVVGVCAEPFWTWRNATIAENRLKRFEAQIRLTEEREKNLEVEAARGLTDPSE